MKSGKVKPRTYFLSFIAAALSAIISIPVFAGIINYIWGEKDVPSTGSSIEIAILATAIAAVVLWFAGKTSNEDERVTKNIEYWGKSLLSSAFLFTIFAFLSPILKSGNITGTPWWDMLIRGVAGGSLILGSAFLIIPICFGVVFIWSRKL